MSLKSIKPIEFLLPKETDFTKWAVIACDQHSANPDYWSKLTTAVNDSPSTLNCIFPEVYLTESAEDITARIAKIQKQMHEYLDSELFQSYGPGVIYLERQTSVGKIRKALILCVDLEQYSFTDLANAAVQPSEATVPERIPPRLAVRRGAALECSHVQLLFHDPKHLVFNHFDTETLANLTQLYDFALNFGGGHARGWYLAADSTLWESLYQSLSKVVNAANFGYEFLVGDGNHSLATAKRYWEELKANGIAAEHPARYALVELINIFDEGLDFEPIHRLLSHSEITNFLDFLNNQKNINLIDIPLPNTDTKTTVELISGDTQKFIQITHGKDLAINILQSILDEYLRQYHPKHPEFLEYIHDEPELRRLAKKPGEIGILAPKLGRESLFPYVAKNGPTARKTFSLGHAADKRYYLELRNLQKNPAKD